MGGGCWERAKSGVGGCGCIRRGQICAGWVWSIWGGARSELLNRCGLIDVLCTIEGYISKVYKKQLVLHSYTIAGSGTYKLDVFWPKIQ